MKNCLHFSILFFFILFSSGLTWSQQIRFTDTTNLWKAGKSVAPDGVPYYSYVKYHAKDAFFEKNGHQYTIVGAEYVPTVMYVREDTVTRKTYVIPVNWNYLQLKVNDTNEFLYMDFSMEIGDTLVMPVVMQGEDDSVSVHVVSDIDSQLIGDRWYKRMWMQVTSGMNASDLNPNSYQVTEGIGAYSGPVIEPEQNGNEYGPYRLDCFSNNGVIPSPFSQTCFNIVSIDEINKRENLFGIYPNPAQDQVTISLLEEIKAGTFEIVDLTGSVITTKDIQSKSMVINVSGVQKGLYLIRLVQGHSVLSVRKLVVK